MLLFLTIIFSIMYKVLLEAFNRGLSTAAGKTFSAFPFEKTRPSWLSCAFTHKQANPFTDKSNGLFFLFSVFYISAPRLLSSKLAIRPSQKICHEYLIPEMLLMRPFSRFKKHPNGEVGRNSETGFTFSSFCLEILNICGSIPQCWMGTLMYVCLI